MVHRSIAVGIAVTRTSRATALPRAHIESHAASLFKLIRGIVRITDSLRCERVQNMKIDV
jgi:hypothetical protein